VGYLRTGRRHMAWPNQYKIEFAILSSLNSFNLLHFNFTLNILKKYQLNCSLLLFY